MNVSPPSANTNALGNIAGNPLLVTFGDSQGLCVVSGMELFEEALRRWEQALTSRGRPADDEASCASVKMGAGDAIAEESMEVSAQTHTHTQYIYVYIYGCIMITI